LGFFGAIHSGVLGSMAARNYAFETFQHRANLTYLRDNDPDSVAVQYRDFGMRWHANVSDKTPANSNDRFIATARRIDFLGKTDDTGNANDIHNKQVNTVVDGKRYTSSDGVNPVWVRTQYGVCLDADKCKGN